MIKNYIEYTINRKRKFIYLEKWRWIYLILFLSLFIISNPKRFDYYEYSELLNYCTLAVTLTSSICLLFYAIPVYLKKQKYKPFIFFTLAIFSLSVFTESMMYRLSAQDLSLMSGFIRDSILYNFNIFTNITSFAFFVETMDEISLRKESKKDLKVLQESQRKLAGTHMDLAFMQDSLSAIKNGMIMDKDYDNTVHSAQILHLSDILRYKLYGYEQESVWIENEVEVMDKIISQRNHYIKLYGGQQISWSYELNDTELGVNKCTLVNILSPVLELDDDEQSKNKLLYLLVENQTASFFIEIDHIDSRNAQRLAFDMREELSRYNKNIYTLTQDFTDFKVTYNITLQLWKK